MIPKQLRHMFKCVFTLQFEEEPPYEYIISTLMKELQKDIRIGPDLQPITHEFEWIRNAASRLRDNIIRENSEFHQSDLSGLSNQLYMDIRSKKLARLDSN